MSDTPEKTLQHYFDDLLGPAPQRQSTPATPVRVAVAERPAPVQAPVVEQLLSKARELEQQETQARQQALVDAEAKAKQAARKREQQRQQVREQQRERALEEAAAAQMEAELAEREAARLAAETAQQQALAEAPEPAPTETPDIETEDAATVVAQWAPALAGHGENGRPLWAQQGFDCLLFSVSGLTLAVPLIALGSIQPLTEELTPLFGQADWFMGLQPTATGDVRVVDTAKLVMPERYDPAFRDSAKYVISIDGLPWGLAVDSVQQPITLQPEEVRWRGRQGGQRAWLAGTVVDHMCALIDVYALGQMLLAADRNARR